MPASYSEIGYKQPKTLCATADLNFGTSPGMGPINAKKFAARVKARREELGMSQKALGKVIGYSQQRMDWLEKGDMQRPERVATGVLAKALNTTIDWLLYEEGPKDAGPRFLATQVFAEKYDQLSADEKAEMTQIIENKHKSSAQKKSA